MNSVIEKINMIRTLPLYIIYLSLSNREIIDKDLSRWAQYHKIREFNKFKQMNWLLSNLKEYRNVFYYRVKSVNRLKYLLIYPIYIQEKTLYISTSNIGGGFVIWHGFSTIINAQSIGENCSVFQQVTIGSIEGQRPIIGDNVDISCGAVVIGGISVGSNCKVGANTTVTKSVPCCCTVVGSQAIIVKEYGKKVNKKL